MPTIRIHRFSLALWSHIFAMRNYPKNLRQKESFDVGKNANYLIRVKRLLENQ